MAPSGLVQIHLTPTISRFVRSPADVVVLYGPRREGKSVGGVAGILYHAEQFPQVSPVRWAVIRDTFTNLERTTVETLMEGMQAGWWRCEFRAQGTEVVLNGGVVRLYLIGMDRPADANKFQGLSLGGVWLEEPAPAVDLASGVPVDVLQMAGSSLQQRGVTRPRIQLTMNPPDEDHWTMALSTHLRRVGRGPMTVETFWIAPGENPHIPATYREKMRALFFGREDLIRRFVEGKPGYVQVGEAVTPEYSDSLHLAPVRLLPRDGLLVVRAWDFGLNPTCVWSQVMPSGRWHILGCRVGDNIGVEQFVDLHLLPWERRVLGEGEGGGWEFRDLGDPAGAMREQSNSEMSAVRCLQDKLQGFVFEPGPVAWEDRRQALKTVLTRTVHGRGLVQLDPVDAAPVRRALRGGAHYPKDSSGRVTATVDAMKRASGMASHPLDCMGYGAAMLYGVPTQASQRARSSRPTVPRAPGPLSWLER